MNQAKRTYNEYLSVNTHLQDQLSSWPIQDLDLLPSLTELLSAGQKKSHDEVEGGSHDSRTSKASSNVTPSVKKRTCKMEQKAMQSVQIQNSQEILSPKVSKHTSQGSMNLPILGSVGNFEYSRDIYSNNQRHNSCHDQNKSDLILNKNLQNQNQSSVYLNQSGYQTQVGHGIDEINTLNQQDKRRLAFQQYLKDLPSKMCQPGRQYSRSKIVSKSSRQVRTLIETHPMEAQRYNDFKSLLRLNKKVWPSVSTCSEDLSQADLTLKSWIDFKQSRDADVLNTLAKSSQGIEQLQHEADEQENAIKTFLQTDNMQQQGLNDFQCDTIKKFLENQVNLRSLLDNLIHQQNGPEKSPDDQQQQNTSQTEELINSVAISESSPKQCEEKQEQSSPLDIKDQAEILIKVITQLFSQDQQPL